MTTKPEQRPLSGELLEVACFAAQRHQYQRRGGYDRLPYINHLLKVCHALMEVGNIYNRDTLFAALLHDILEDTPTSFEELSNRFSPQVAHIVKELTDDMSLPYAERKVLQIQGVGELSFPAQQIRIVDKGSNIEDISSYPLNWTSNRKMAYIKFAQDVINPLRNNHKLLIEWFDGQVHRALERLSKK